jgi:hypothetical protein
MELELKHLAAYLPYGLKVQHNSYSNGRLDTIYCSIECLSDECVTFSSFMAEDYHFGSKENDCEFKPILRPLSMLGKEIEVNGERFIPIDWFEIGDDCNNSVDYGQGNVKLIGLLKDMAKHKFIQLEYLNYGVVEKLCEWHFDIFGLIDAGLAIEMEDSHGR